MESKAILLEDEGKYAEAEPLRRQIVADRKHDIETNKERTAAGVSNIAELNTYRQWALAQRALAMNFVKQQKLAGAEGILRKRLYLSLQKRGRFFIGTGADFTALSNVLYEQGRYSEALETAEVGLDIFAKLGLRPESLNVVHGRRARAAVLIAEARYREALTELELMKQGLASSPYLLARLGKGDVDWALALVRSARAAEAVTMLQPLVADLEQRHGPDNYETAETRGFLALALAAAGRRDEAVALFARTVPVLVAAGESTDGRVRTPVRTRLYVLMLEAYLEVLADARAQTAARAAGLDPAAEAFRVADLARPQGVQRALTSGAARAAATDPALAALVTREQDGAQRLSALRDLLTSLLASPPGERSEQVVKRLRAEIADLEKQRRALYKEIEQRFPSFANLLNPKPATVEAVRNGLADSEALLAVYVGAERSYVWAVARSGAVGFAVVPLGAAQIEQSVTQLRKALDPGAATLGNMPAFDVAEGYKLYRELLKPVEAVWRGKQSLLVVPHGAPGRLPFALLPTQPVALGSDQRLLFENYRAVPWLVRDAAVTQYPSASAFVALRARAGHRRRRERGGTERGQLERACAGPAPAGYRRGDPRDRARAGRRSRAGRVPATARQRGAGAARQPRQPQDRHVRHARPGAGRARRAWSAGAGAHRAGAGGRGRRRPAYDE